MATFAQAFSLLSLILQIHLFSAGNAKTLTIINNCSYTVWPAIATSSGTGSANVFGFALHEGESSVVAISTEWNGRVWGRTLCSINKSTGHFSCQTGVCTTGNIQCTSSYITPVTLAEFSLGQFNNEDFYDVSVLAGYNLPLLVAPSVASLPGCKVIGYVFDLQKSCQLAKLRVISVSVVGKVTKTRRCDSSL
ncbi:PR5-like receptor kinase [Silene latifolia]|uniref:PR5-like receptor kinase n=1 Tax=Silene latifolia TaxID=37657 RepID=UPI003D76F802